jgi:2-polyprenyl-6-methoxyphenol hydroxylase-like FAD-dependent oxidoreductase
MSSLRIAIIGGGPAGLTLARLLQINNTLCTVFELDTQAVSRDQGGTVDLHPRGGQLALKHAGLTDEFKKYSRPEGEAMKLLKYDGRVVFDENMEGNVRPEEYADRPEIDRMKLRQLLFQSLEPGTVVWTKKLQRVEKSLTNPGQYDLQFEDGREEGFDLVVGADGAWSKVRSYLTSQQPYYSGVTAIELWATEFDKKHQWLSDFVGAGNCFMFDEGRAIQCQKLGNNSIRVYAGVRQPESWLENCGIDWSQPEKARKELVKQYYADCGEDLKRAVLDANDKLVPRKMWMLPVGYRWKSDGGVTLIGDAAHLMTPYAGVGVNLAMIDSLDLAKAIIGCDGDSSNIPGAIKAFEDEMLTRVEQFAKKTYKGLIGHFSANGCEELLERLKGR